MTDNLQEQEAIVGLKLKAARYPAGAVTLVTIAGPLGILRAIARVLHAQNARQAMIWDLAIVPNGLRLAP